MKILFTSLVILSFVLMAQAQSFTIEWDKRFGGTGEDVIRPILQTDDGGYLLGITTTSEISGDKTLAGHGEKDVWLVKIDADGNKLWEKIFGGAGDDDISMIKKTADGGYILACTSKSGISGNKSDSCRGDNDYWVVKLDANCNKLWDKTYGGRGLDHLSSIQQTKDGGYIVGGEAKSGKSGDKTDGDIDTWPFFLAYFRAEDFWILKIDANGNKQWDKTFGGDEYERPLSLLHQTADGGYILAGGSNSGISGNKTKDNWNWNSINPLGDTWIVKMDSDGIKQWEKVIGSMGYDSQSSFQPTDDGGYILGMSPGGTGGDITSTNTSAYAQYFMMKLDSNCNKLWEKEFGTADYDEFLTIQQTLDGGYLLTGNSYSNKNGDKTEDNLCREETWVVKTDANGKKLWDKTLHTMANVGEEVEDGYGIETKDGCYLLYNNNYSGIAGDKTQENWVNQSPLQPGYYSMDGWIVKICVENNCEGSNIFIPDVFSPNNDGENDFLYVMGTNCVQSLLFSIYNRWGEKVFESHKQNDGWDGVFKNKKLNTGVFIYKLEAEMKSGEHITKKGNITLIR